MQKAFIAIALALTLTCVAATYTATGYVKAPTDVAKNDETNFTNSSSLNLRSLNVGELDLVSRNDVENKTVPSGWTYNYYYRKLDAKALTGNANTTFTFYDSITFFLGGFAIVVTEKGINDTTTQPPNIRVAQGPISGGAQIPAINVSSNTNANFTPVLVGLGVIDKTVYVFVLVADKKINVTSFTAGGSAGKTDFTLTSAYESDLEAVWGEALGKNQLYVTWKETGNAYKAGAVDVSKGTHSAAAPGGWDGNYSCDPYATDKKLFGVWCSKSLNASDPKAATGYWATTVNNTLLAVTNNSNNTNLAYTARSVVPYGPYLAVFYTDVATTPGSTLYWHEIWDLEKITPSKARTQYLTKDASSTAQNFRVTSGGYYTLLYNNRPFPNPNGTTLTSVQVGLLLGSSYLATVFGFLLTIIAGLFLF